MPAFFKHSMVHFADSCRLISDEYSNHDERTKQMSRQINIKHMLHDSEDPGDIMRCMGDLEEYLRTQPFMEEFPRMNDFSSIETPEDMDMILSDLFRFCEENGIDVD